MKLYLAGIYTASFHRTGQLYNRLTDREKAYHQGVQHYLESYHYIHRQSYVDRIRADGTKVFLDSGAFSAFTKGVEVDLEGYCDYILRNLDIIETVDGAICASVLDGIGDPLKTWQNQQYMERLGVRPLPCFHYGEDERYLEWYMANYEYITLGGMVPISTPQLYHWLDRIWEKYLTDGSGRPRLKVHGFGLTVIPLMERYPWFSVDSSSWVQSSSNGNIQMNGLGIISVSSNSPSAKVYGRHMDTLPPIQQKALLDRLEKEGFDPQRLREEYITRWVYNCMSFTELNQMINARKGEEFHNESYTLF